MSYPTVQASAPRWNARPAGSDALCRRRGPHPPDQPPAVVVTAEVALDASERPAAAAAVVVRVLHFRQTHISHRTQHPYERTENPCTPALPSGTHGAVTKAPTVTATPSQAVTREQRAVYRCEPAPRRSDMDVLNAPAPAFGGATATRLRLEIAMITSPPWRRKKL